MTHQETTALIDLHLSGWLGSDSPTPTIRERLAAMIADVEAMRDELWQSGNATLRHERDAARTALEARELALQEACKLGEEMSADKARMDWLETNKVSGGGAFLKQWTIRDNENTGSLRAAIDAAMKP